MSKPARPAAISAVCINFGIIKFELFTRIAPSPTATHKSYLWRLGLEFLNLLGRPGAEGKSGSRYDLIGFNLSTIDDVKIRDSGELAKIIWNCNCFADK